MEFYKYHGTGNDFIMFDDRQEDFPDDNIDFIANLCHRRFGIGADGLILLRNEPGFDFKMVYFNSDGKPSSMCGNGGRCVVAFARDLGVVENKAKFLAIDGAHHAKIKTDTVSLGMNDVDGVKKKPNAYFLDTGSPHHVQFVEGLGKMDVKKEGSRLRYGIYGQVGSNINFVKIDNGTDFEMRTYERGVEDETYSCGTGAVATAIAMHYGGHSNSDEISLKTLGGPLKVKFQNDSGKYSKVELIGPAKFVFKGNVELPCKS